MDTLRICKECYWFDKEENLCLNCNSPSDIRRKKPHELCDGGGIGAEYGGFTDREISERQRRIETWKTRQRFTF